MTPFTRLDAIAAPLPLANVDTDKILPARFLKTVSRDGLGEALFASMRTDPDFVLNRPPWNRAGILIALGNFGCGSSREHAPWALLDFGIRCVIAPDFADIFYANCFKNGILPVALPEDIIRTLMVLAGDPATAQMCVDLEACRISTANAGEYTFQIQDQRRRDLLMGVDEIDRSLGAVSDIEAYENAANTSRPWIVPVTPGAITGT